MVITIENICATDPDSDDSTLMYMIARQPYYGVVQRNGFIVDRFRQADVTAGVVSYRHTGDNLRLCINLSALIWFGCLVMQVIFLSHFIFMCFVISNYKNICINKYMFVMYI